MKHFSKCERGKLCSFLLVLLCAFSAASAQDYAQQRKETLNGLDLSGLGKTLFLNAGVTNQHEVDYFKTLSKSVLLKPEPVTSEEWRNLYERLMDTDLRPGSGLFRNLDQLIETDPAKLSKNNVVPIGIMNMESIYLSGKQIADNEATKKAGKSVDFSTYEKVRIVSVAVLQEDVYQAEVSFRISLDLLITNHTGRPESIELDFNDGKGYKTYPISDNLVHHRFESTGEQKIGIRLRVDNKTFLFETKVNVRQLERIKPYKEFQVMAERISKDTLADQSARTMLVGGNIRIILGCDQILNKPIIIAEGFDIGQDVTLDAIEANYRFPLAQYLTEGYDLVLLDYSDARAAMEDNAQVLKALIQQVNQMKTGNAQSIVIGESMSGMVARWALRQMENEGIVHQVKLMLCYDTPHQGANVPVGLTQLMREANPTLFTQVILKFFAKRWRDYFLAINTPAARQMLLHWGGHLTGGVGSKHPDFEAFHTQLAALGNGGYPQNCRNIAVTHGSMDAGDRELFDRYNYGERILRSWVPFVLQNANIDVHTSQLSQNTNVLRFASWGILSKAIGISRFYNSPLNDDFLPGGRTNVAVPNKLFKSTDDFNFCFVPTFSAIDYQGPRNTQAERELLNVTAVNAVIINRQTPFAAIYGNDENTDHVRAENIQWNVIGVAEGLLTFITACPVLPTPSIPTITTFNICHSFSEKRTTEDNTPNITVSLTTPSGGLYVHNWTVFPSNLYFTTTGDQITFPAERADHYEITCVRTYPNRRDLQSTFTTTIIVDDCSDVTVGSDPNPYLVVDADIDITDIWEGDFLLTTPKPDSLAAFAHYTPDSEILYATLEDGTFVPSTTLQTSGMFPEFAALFADTDPRVPLPVHLIAFNVTTEGKAAAAGAALLTWSTASEINSDHFEIEKSNTGKDWQKIGSIPAQNPGSKTTEYSYVDQNIGSNVMYYRLKMVDTDGTFAYSRMQSTYFDQDSDMGVFPNPVDTDTQLQLLLGDKKVSHISIYNLAGKEVFESDKPISQIDMHGLPTGKYIARIRLRDGSERTHAFVKR
ncbi:MAG: T9SS type A sorting domain-containing protein [Dyadobacter sp.]|uniref:T9SS type A sorting domain-containing protein n=1 Tax=Dyadobacter sp. TaxID=1914288 RepID=UPI003265EAB7